MCPTCLLRESEQGARDERERQREAREFPMGIQEAEIQREQREAGRGMGRRITLRAR